MSVKLTYPKNLMLFDISPIQFPKLDFPCMLVLDHFFKVSCERLEEETRGVETKVPNIKSRKNNDLKNKGKEIRDN